MPISRLRAHTPPLTPCLLILTSLVCLAAPDPAFALRNVGHVEVTSESSRITTMRQVATTILATVARGTILEVLEKDQDSYWILMDPDLNGVRRAGWITATDVAERPDLDVVASAAAPGAGNQAQGEADQEASTPSTPAAVESQEIVVAPSLMAVVLNFEFDSVELSVDARGKLDEMAEQLGPTRSASIEIEGHTDSAGTTAYNQALGLRRAEVVRQYLSEQHQIPSDRMTIASFGEDAPVGTNDTAEGRALNRRVVVTF